MNLLSIAKYLVVASGALAAAACSSSSDDGKCGAPVITGAPLLSSGTGAVHGSGTLPATIASGQQLQLFVKTTNTTGSVLPENLFEETLTCGAGSSFTFTITHLDAGTYNLGYDIYARSSEDTDPSFTGTSTNTFVVADGQSVEFTPTF
jgi:hypothetical protein